MENKKICFKCKKEKILSDFYKHPNMSDGRVNKCKECNKKDNKNNWHLKIDEKKKYDNYRQRYSIQRIFNHRYSGIKRRCLLGGTNGRIYGVTGKEFLSKNEWNDWCYDIKNYKKFIMIYNNWVKSNFNEGLSPSVDRINNDLSYTPENIQWLTKLDNCKKYIK